jgi:hypothetical protein
MAKIAFLLMVHKDPARVIRQANALTTHGDTVAIHVDGRMPRADFRKIRDGVANNPSVTLARRTKCGWGEWSLVQASLNLIHAARSAFTGITHYFLISGDCMPTKSRGYIDAFVSQDRDVIEAHDFFETDWIRTGLKRDRLVYRHWVNERKRKWLFYRLLELQRRFGWSRPLPKGIRICIGSQWWCLRASTIDAILTLLRRRRDLIRFFRTTWIPDETFFQTLANHVTGQDQLSMHPPTTLLFSDYGMPVVFYGDHHDFLRAQDQPFARKISANAHELESRLWQAFENWDSDRTEGGGTARIYGYLSGRGRNGQRYAKRFWERAIAPRRNAEVLIVAANLWHLGKAFEQAVSRITNIPALGYIFDDDVDIPLPLGNLENGLFKRDQHRHALVNLVFDALGTNRMILTIDPARVDVIEDVAGIAGEIRILLVDRPLTDAHFRDHAERAGLLNDKSGAFEEAEVLKAIASEFKAGTDALRQRFRGRLFNNRLDAPRDENVTEIGHFLQVPRVQAEAVARETERLVS